MLGIYDWELKGRLLLGLPRPVAAAFLALFTIAILAYGWAWPQAPVETGDSRLYLNLTNYLADWVKGAPQENVNLLDLVEERGPGYPVMLTLAGVRQDTPRRAFYLNLIMHFAAVWLMAKVLWMLGFGVPSLIGFGLLACLPPYLESAAWLMTETAAEFTLALGFSALVSWMAGRSRIWLAVAAAAFAYSGLVRVTYQMLCQTLAVGLLLISWVAGLPRIRGKSVYVPVAALAAAWLLLVGGYAMFYYSRTGYLGVSYSMGLNLTTKTVGFVERLPDEDTAVREFLYKRVNEARTRRDSSHTGTMYIWGPTFRELGVLTGLGAVDTSKLLLKLNVKLIARAPLEYLQTVGAAAATYWFPYTTYANLGSRILQGVWLLTHFAVVGIFFTQLAAMAVIGGAEWLKMLGIRRRGGAVQLSGQATLNTMTYGVCLTIVFYTLLVSCLFDIGSPRYRAPTDLLILMACFAGVRVIWQRGKDLVAGSGGVVKEPEPELSRRGL